MNIEKIKIYESDYIYPKNSNFSQKNFLFYLTHSSLQQNYRSPVYIGYTRYICSLNNNFEITINRHSALYKKHELVSFKSEDDVIIKDSVKLYDITLKEDLSNYNVVVNNGFNTYKDNFILVTALEECQVFIGSQTYDLQVEECLIIENLNRETIDLVSPKLAIIATINLAHQEIF